MSGDFIFDDFLIDGTDFNCELRTNTLNQNLAIIAFEKLYGFKPVVNVTLVYSGRFKSYGANVSYNSKFVKFKLSKSWEGVSDDIVIGLIQSLWNKIKKTNILTLNQNLYNTYIKKISDYSVADTKDGVLLESFNRVNKIYFNDLMDCPNLLWGKYSKKVLGFYDYLTNRIVISSILKFADEKILDFVMYHELLHKKLSFSVSKTGRRAYHTSEFRQLEAKYAVKDIETRIKSFLKGF